MSNLTPLQVAQYASQAGFSGLALINAVAIAMAESGGNTTAINRGTPGNPENSQGLWQINLDAHPQYNGTQILDPLANAQAAYAISNGGSDFSPWSTWLNGAYRGFLLQATNAAASLKGLPSIDPTGGVTVPPIAPPSIALPPINLPSTPDIPGAIRSAGQGAISAIQQAIQPITSGIANLNQFLSFVADPQATRGVLMVGTGALVTLLGIVLFGLSLIPNKGGNVAIPIPL